ncbi:MAG: hypothetical protein NZL88_10475, partial [Gaiellaceae bacterium]|nr:hypothetical protein [Gaiellaceae bacterium]
PIPLAALGKLSRLDRLEPEAGPAVVDCRAGLDPEALGERLRRGDLVLVPVLPSPLDLEASLAFLRGLAREGQVARGRAGVLVFLNRSRPEGRATAAVRAALAETPVPG